MASPDVVLEPSLTVQLLAWTAAGVLLGSVSGLIPGLHANNFALLLAGVAPSVPGPPLFVGVAMLAAGVVHTFLNAIPSMALGVPDAEMAMTALPGHKMVLEGRGYEAIRLSALGSILAVLAAVPLAIPLTIGVTAAYPTLQAHMSLLLAMVLAAMVAAEPRWRSRGGGLLTIVLATALGLVTLDLEPDAPLDGGGMLAPIFAGLFGAPVLIDAMRGGGVPRQGDPALTMPRTILLWTALAGTLSGAIVGYLPGISAAIAAVAVLALVPGGSTDRGYIVATSGVDTSNAIFALFALVAIGQPRSGVMVAYESTGAPVDLPILVTAVVLAGLAGFVLVISVGDVYLEIVGRASYWRISVAILVLLLLLSLLFTGPLGLVVFAASTAIGLVPVRTGARRVNCMAVLMGPLVIDY